MKKICVFASGSGTNLQSLIDAEKNGYIKKGKIVLVFSDKKEAYALKRAQNNNIQTICISPENYRTREEYDLDIVKIMNEKKIDLICLAGYMRILTKEFLDNFKGDIMNIHPALLPSFGGKGMYGINVHKAVLEYGVKVTGATVHFVDYETDTGPIILQKCVPVNPDDTPEKLQQRVLKIEHEIYKEAVRLYTEEKLKVIGRKVIIKS